MIIQLNPAIPLVTPKGPGMAWFVIDYSEESNIFFVVADDATGEIWIWNNQVVRAQKNITLGRGELGTPWPKGDLE